MAASSGSASPRTAQRRAVRLLAAVFVVYGLLVATHLGEFWPFSIYPMFSQGGNPWSRALVMDVTDEPVVRWDTLRVEELWGTPYPLLPNGIDPIDLANFVSKTQTWDEARVTGLQRMFYDQLEGRRLLVYRVNGRLHDTERVQVRYVPYVLIGADTSALHPALTSALPAD
ncbi:MAG: hypothetical protein AAGI71_00470 [Bacteroidota bacterium]